jgi:hypothetical protein
MTRGEATCFPDRAAVAFSRRGALIWVFLKQSRSSNGPRLKGAIQAVTTKDDRVRPIDTIPLKSCNISFLPL